MRTAFSLLLVLLVPATHSQELPQVSGVAPQPLLAQALRLSEALSFMGSRLHAEDLDQLLRLRDEAPSADTTAAVQRILDPYCLAMVEINPEARVKVVRGPAAAELVQDGWTSFLVKVENGAGLKGRLEVSSPNALPALHISTYAPRVAERNVLSPGDSANRFLELDLYRQRPLLGQLSGLGLEYVILQAYTREVGIREARLGFRVGPGTTDLGFRNALDVLFEIRPSVEVVLRVRDHDGSPTMASFVITDGIDRFFEEPGEDTREVLSESFRSSVGTVIHLARPLPDDYRRNLALYRPSDWTRGGDPIRELVKPLVGIYPMPARRVAENDEYPDFFFQPQIYRSDGEHVRLPPGTYEVEFTRGPEYLAQSRQITVPEGVERHEETFQLRRWVNLRERGYYSADHHVHSAGCSHYESPAQGVHPEHMWRQAAGEGLDIAAVLNWGPGWYYQKRFFRGGLDPVSDDKSLVRYDVEVSGFPSSHAGHVCLLRLQEDDYPETTKIEEWPSWTLPVLRWAKSQGGVTGYAHSGFGLAPIEPTDALPNYVLPSMDGIGANEFIVTVVHDVVDFISAGDTPYPWELNIWYHTLNAGFRTRISGETDYPCVYDERVGMARSYAKLDGALDFDVFMSRIQEGRSYVSEGRSHLIDLAVDGVELGTNDSEVHLEGPRRVKVTALATAYLPPEQEEIGSLIAARPPTEQPYWDIERARIHGSRRVPVELVINGEAVASREIEADGEWVEIEFEALVERSSWITLRILPSSHTNPVFVLVNDQPIRASRRSAQWCRDAVDRCWLMKSPQIREADLPAAEAAYDRAREVYDEIVRTSPPDS